LISSSPGVAVRLGGPGPGRHPEADYRAAGDHRGAVCGLPGGRDRVADLVGVVPVDLLHVPAAGTEAGGLVVRHGQRGRAVDGDGVVVEEQDQLAELEVPGERDGLMADALHQAAVAGEHVGVVVHQLRPELRRQDALAKRQADRVADALAERAGRGLDPVGVLVFRVPRRLAADLAEALDLLKRHVLHPRQVEEGIQQHRAVAVGQQEAVAVDPVGIGGVELHEVAVEHGRDVGHARMAGLRALHGVDGKEADAVRQPAQLGVLRHRHGCHRRAGIGRGISGAHGLDPLPREGLLSREAPCFSV